MGRKRHWRPLVSVIALATGVSLMVAAHGVAANGAKVSPKNPQAFGTLRAVLDTIDYLDPQQAYTGQSWWAMWNVYETLLTYRHVDGPAGYKLVPGLASSLPTVSRNGKVYKFKLRKGLKYSNGAARQGLRLRVGDQARLPRPGSGRRLLHRHRRGRGLFEEPDSGRRHLGNRHEQREANDQHQARQAARRLPDDPRSPVRGAGAR
jgi:ABC-type dipeptide transport system, periplasmic component